MSSKSIKKGAILLARPSLSIDIFTRSVVLITEHYEGGTMGFILNKSLNLPANIFLPCIDGEHIISEGGPVDRENIYYLHKRPDLIKDSIHVVNDIYWSGDFSDVVKAFKANLISPNELKFYLGYCGWTPNQLQDEITNKEWEVLEYKDIDAFESLDNELWTGLLKKLGGDNLLWLNTPLDPSMN